jgi:hypothetical protein
LHVPVFPHGLLRPGVHLLEGGERVGVPEVGAQPVDDPVGVAEPRGVVGPLDRRVRDAAQHGVDKAPDLLRRQRDRLAHGRVGRHVGEMELVRAEAKDPAHVRGDGSQQKAVDEEVARPPHPRRAVHELGHEASVALRELGTRELTRNCEVRVRALRLDSAQGLQGYGPRVHVPS